MTKRALLDIMENTSLKYDPDVFKKSIYYKYCRQIITLLSVLPDNAQIEGIVCLEKKEFSNLSLFENFIRGNVEDIEFTLHSLSEALSLWTENYIRVRSTEATVLNCKNRKTHWGTVIFLAIIIPTVIVAVIFSILDIVGLIDYGNQLSTAIGCLDFLCGIGFFIYELLSDREKDKVHKDAEESSVNGDYAQFYSIYENEINSHNCIFGCGNSVGYRHGNGFDKYER